jgi:hypothetical protein
VGCNSSYSVVCGLQQLTPPETCTLMFWLCTISQIAVAIACRGAYTNSVVKRPLWTFVGTACLCARAVSRCAASLTATMTEPRQSHKHSRQKRRPRRILACSPEAKNAAFWAGEGGRQSSSDAGCEQHKSRRAATHASHAHVLTALGRRRS